MEYPFAQTMLNTLNAIAGFNTLLVFVLLFRYSKEFAPANRMLGLYLLGTAMVNLMIYLIQSKNIYAVYWMFRLPSPLYYLMFPAAWLYVKMLVRDQVRLRPVDYLHFFPAFLHFIELTPYLLSSQEIKIAHITESLENPMGAYLHNEGILPPFTHNVLRAVSGMAYGLAIFLLLLRENKKHDSSIHLYPGLTKWLYIFATMELLFSIGLVTSFIFTGWGTLQYRSMNVGFWAALTQIATSIALITNPSYLFGMPRLGTIPSGKPTFAPAATEAAKTIPDKALNPQDSTPAGPGTVNQNPPFAELQLDQELLKRYDTMLQAYQEESTSYLQPRFSIRQMADELKIPQHHLSYVLNKLYNIRFNDFVNQLRIQNLEKKIQEENTLSKMTLEGAAREAGFSNRSTFIRAVKRITGKNPSAYFKG